MRLTQVVLKLATIGFILVDSSGSGNCKETFTTSADRIASPKHPAGIHEVQILDGYLLTVFRVPYSPELKKAGWGKNRHKRFIKEAKDTELKGKGDLSDGHKGNPSSGSVHKHEGSHKKGFTEKCSDSAHKTRKVHHDSGKSYKEGWSHDNGKYRHKRFIEKAKDKVNGAKDTEFKGKGDLSDGHKRNPSSGSVHKHEGSHKKGFTEKCSDSAHKFGKEHHSSGKSYKESWGHHHGKYRHKRFIEKAKEKVNGAKDTEFVGKGDLSDGHHGSPSSESAHKHEGSHKKGFTDKCSDSAHKFGKEHHSSGKSYKESWGHHHGKYRHKRFIEKAKEKVNGAKDTEFVGKGDLSDGHHGSPSSESAHKHEGSHKKGFTEKYSDSAHKFGKEHHSSGKSYKESWGHHHGKYRHKRFIEKAKEKVNGAKDTEFKGKGDLSDGHQGSPSSESGFTEKCSDSAHKSGKEHHHSGKSYKEGWGHHYGKYRHKRFIQKGKDKVNGAKDTEFKGKGDLSDGQKVSPSRVSAHKHEGSHKNGFTEKCSDSLHKSGKEHHNSGKSYKKGWGQHYGKYRHKRFIEKAKDKVDGAKDAEFKGKGDHSDGHKGSLYSGSGHKHADLNKKGLKEKCTDSSHKSGQDHHDLRKSYKESWGHHGWENHYVKYRHKRFVKKGKKKSPRTGGYKRKSSYSGGHKGSYSRGYKYGNSKKHG